MATKAPTGYQRLTDKERTLIYEWRQARKPIREIAQLLGKNASSISREVHRNAGDRGYRPKQASAKARARLAARSGKPRRLTEELWEEAKEGLRRGWSFDMVCNRAAFEGRPHVSRETLYRRYYQRQKAGEELPPLPRSHRKRHKRGKSNSAGRGHIPNRVDIDVRPKSVEGRKRTGHWEGDLVCGLAGTGYLVTLVERKTRFALFSYVATKETDVVMDEVVRLMGGLHRGALKTLTFDNGKEFARHDLVTGQLGIPVYFAHPYHSWERGTNENRNGVIRRVLPKGSSFAGITPEQFGRIDSMLNDRPLRCLGWMTPREAVSQHRARASPEAS